MPPWVHLPNTVPSDIVLEPKEDACTVAEDIVDNVSNLQVSLGQVSEGMKKLHAAMRALDSENHKLRHENSMLQAQLARGMAAPTNGAFAGTGEMPPTPREGCLVSAEPPSSGKVSVYEPDPGQSPAYLFSETNQSFFSFGMNSAGMSMDGQPMQSPTSAGPQARDCQARETVAGNQLDVPQPLQRKSAKKLKRTTTQGALVRGIFADPVAMKDAVRQAIARPTFDVTNFYYDEGWFQWIARSPAFEYGTLAIIFVNAIWIAIDCEYNTGAEVHKAAVFTVADNLFCAYFFTELVIRAFAFEFKRNVLKDAWFAFDLGLVLLMVVETWFLPFFWAVWGQETGELDISDSSLLRTMRLLRITRMARMVKLLRCVPELIIVIKGIGVALRSVMYTWVLMVAVIYVFAIAFRQIAFDTPLGRKYFDGVGEAMYTLLLRGTLPDLADFMIEVGHESIGLAIILMLFILLVSLTVMNMLIGVLVDVVGVVSKVENYELQVAFVKQRLLGMMEETGLDEDGNQRISKEEFGSMLVKPEAARILNDLGVDPVGLVDFTDFIFKDEDELDFPGFMDVILQLRGTNGATVRDVVDMRKWVAEEFRHLERTLGVQRGSTVTGMSSLNLRRSRVNTPANAASRPAWDAPAAIKPSKTAPAAYGLIPARAVNFKTDNDDHVKPLMPHSATHDAAQEGPRSKKGSAILWRPGVEDDMWDEEV